MIDYKHSAGIHSSVQTLNWFQRILSGLLLMQAICLAPDFMSLFDGSGFYRHELINTLGNVVPRADHLKPIVKRLFGVSGSLPLAFFVVYCASLSVMLFECKYVLWPIVALTSKLLWSQNSPGAIYGVDQFSTICLFIILAARSHTTVPGWISKIVETQSTLYFLLRFVLCLCYFSSGIEKAMGFDWWNGNSIWRAAHFAIDGTILIPLCLTVPGIAVLAGLGTLIVEAGYPLFCYWGKTRKLIVFSAISMHIGIMLGMGLYFFGSLMIVMNIFAWYGDSFVNCTRKITGFMGLKIAVNSYQRDV